MINPDPMPECTCGAGNDAWHHTWNCVRIHPARSANPIPEPSDYDKAMSQVPKAAAEADRKQAELMTAPLPERIREILERYQERNNAAAAVSNLGKIDDAENQATAALTALVTEARIAELYNMAMRFDGLTVDEAESELANRIVELEGRTND